MIGKESIKFDKPSKLDVEKSREEKKREEGAFSIKNFLSILVNLSILCAVGYFFVYIVYDINFIAIALFLGSLSLIIDIINIISRRKSLCAKKFLQYTSILKIYIYVLYLIIVIAQGFAEMGFFELYSDGVELILGFTILISFDRVASFIEKFYKNRLVIKRLNFLKEREYILQIFMICRELVDANDIQHNELLFVLCKIHFHLKQMRSYYIILEDSAVTTLKSFNYYKTKTLNLLKTAKNIRNSQEANAFYNNYTVPQS